VWRLQHIALFLVVLSGCSAFEPYESVVGEPRATVKVQTNAGKLDLLVFEPDEHCKLTFSGRVKAKADEPATTFYVPPGRAYFRLSPDLAYTTIGLEDVSFNVEADQQYLIEFKKLGTDFKWYGSKLQYEYGYLNTSGEFPVPVTVDHFSVCEREMGLVN